MSGNTAYLSTGANRGKHWSRSTAAYLSRPDNTVIAAVRDPSHATAKSLPELFKGHGSALITVKLDSSVPADAATVIQSLQSEHNISALDVIIANAGINDDSNFGPVAQLSIDVLVQHVRINAYAPLLHLQAALPLLEKAKTPKFVAITGGIGSIGIMEHVPFPMGGYGASKAVLNFLVSKLHFENEKLIIFSLSPGFVQTDMGNAAADYVGMKEAPTTLDASINGIVKLVDAATRQETSGHFLSFDGREIPW